MVSQRPAAGNEPAAGSHIELTVATVRAGVLRLLSTVSGVVVTHGTLDGQPTLVVRDVTPSLNGHGRSEAVVTLNASTGIPLEYTDGTVGKTPDTTTTYRVSRVTVAAIAAGKF